MKYSTFIFDFDYTLADSSKGIVICYRNTIKQFGFPDASDFAIKRTIGKTIEDSLCELTGECDRDKLKTMKTFYASQADIYMTPNTFIYPCAVAVLGWLHEQSYHIGIVSTKLEHRIREAFISNPPGEIFDVLIGGADVSAPKPDPQGLLLALSKLSCPKERALYIGDSLIDAETARRAGVDFAAALSGATTHDEFADYDCIAAETDLLTLFEKIVPSLSAHCL